MKAYTLITIPKDLYLHFCRVLSHLCPPLSFLSNAVEIFSNSSITPYLLPKITGIPGGSH
jgi:hypothetical protein